MKRAVEERVREWQELVEEARAHPGGSRGCRGREEPRGLTPEEFERLAAKGALWYLDGALRL